jgi:hypothetical protein
MAEAKVEGFVATGFERVREAFAENFRAGREVGASFAVARDGALVVDLWGGFRDRARTQPWARDTLVNAWSTTKAVSNIAANASRSWCDCASCRLVGMTRRITVVYSRRTTIIGRSHYDCDKRH